MLLCYLLDWSLAESASSPRYRLSRDTEADTEPETTESLEPVVREETEETPGPHPESVTTPLSASRAPGQTLK